jgi:hypothetical protein
MTRTRVLTALLAGLTLAGVGTALGAAGAPAPVGVVAQTRTLAPTGAAFATPTVDVIAPTTVTADDARARAVAHLGTGTVTKVEREVEHGRTVWDVDVRRGSRVVEVHVDAGTGAISRVEDTAGDRARDDRGRDDRGGHHGADDGAGHDRFDDKGGDR